MRMRFNVNGIELDKLLDKCNANLTPNLDSRRYTVLVSLWGDALDSEPNRLDGGEEMQLADRVPVDCRTSNVGRLPRNAVYGCESASDDDIDALITEMLSLTSRLEGRK